MASLVDAHAAGVLELTVVVPPGQPPGNQSSLTAADTPDQTSTVCVTRPACQRSQVSCGEQGKGRSP
ncbi:MAG: hypothetical protein ACRDWT_08350, partial [Jatrophihabitantaceae bacterium]